MHGVTGDTTLNGTFIVAQIVSRTPGVALTFSYLSGGKNATVDNAGWVQTKWPDYGKNVYAEFLLGNQILGQTFNGMVTTPWQGTGAPNGPQMNNGPAGNNPAPNIPYGPNPWTTYCSLQGKTAVFLRLQYDQTKFPAGIPQVAFLLHGKSDIYDPRLGGLTGIKTVTLYNPGSGGYFAGDVLTPAGGSGGAVTITTVDGSGNPTAWMVTQTGNGYALGVQSASGGHGSGAQFNITVLGGVSAGISGVSIDFGGNGFLVGDIVQVAGGSLGFLAVSSTGSGGAATGLTVLYPGFGYGTGTGVATLPGFATGSLTDGGYGLLINITAVVGGVNSSAVYTENSALCIADYLAHPIWGYGAQYCLESSTPAPWNNVGITALTTAANQCDTAISLAAGGTEPMWACNGRFDLSMSRGTVLQNLLTSCAGRLTYVGGIYTIYPAFWLGTSPPQINLSAIAAGPVRWKGISIRDLYNGVKGTYIAPYNRWQQSDFPAYAQDALHGYGGPSQYAGDINLAQDGGQRRWKDVHLQFTISSRQAQQTAKVDLLRMRMQGGGPVWTGTFSLTLAGMRFVPMDVILAISAQLGWVNELVEVVAVRFRADKQGQDGKAAVALTTEIDVQQTSVDITSWSTDEELTPEGYQQATPPTATVTEAVCFPWSPGGVAPLDGDALYLAGTNGPGNFALLPIYGQDAQGISTAALQISGYPVINSLDKEIGAPFVTAVASVTGGALASGTYVIGVSAYDGSGAGYQNTPYLDFATVTVPGGGGLSSITGTGGASYRIGDMLSVEGGNGGTAVVTGIDGYATGSVTSVSLADPGNGYSTGSQGVTGGSGTGAIITISAVTAATNTGSITVTVDWGAGDTYGGELYMAQQSLSGPLLASLVSAGQQLAQNVMHWQQTLSPSTTTASIAAFNASRHGGPDTLCDHYGITWQEVTHSGPWAEQVQAVTGTSGTSPGTVTIAGPGMTTNQWAGYTLSLLAHFNPATPVQILNMPIESSTASSGGLFTLTIGQNAVGQQLPSLTSELAVGDLVTVLLNATFTANSYTDPNIANGYYPTGDTGIEAGHLAMVLDGPDAGDVQPIASISGTNNITVNLAGAWQVTPNAGDTVIVVAPSTVPEWRSNSASTPNASGGVSVVATPSIQNLLGQVWLVTVRTEAADNSAPPDFVNPKRMIYFFGAAETVTVLT
jgi:hypothetical protein